MMNSEEWMAIHELPLAPRVHIDKIPRIIQHTRATDTGLL